MTLRDKVREVYPENVHDGFSGGVARCPHDYDFLNNQDSRENCNNTNCNECWDREYKPDNNQNEPVKSKELNIKEMREIIQTHCINHLGICDNCILRDLKENEKCFSDDSTGFETRLKNRCEEIAKFTKEMVNNQKEAPNDPIKPTYYNDTNITPFEVIDDWNLDFYLGNAIKYIKRAGKKKNNSRLQDLKKIREYVDQEIRLEENSQNV